ncbi:hypothetical protein EJ06DRAFT_546821 [Trichodelitschia bisporula]|uniref:Uncharacterized protein n=1 Tax=Trichodelitschia bisporula TaxID=703511 RepID=A0A6G1I6G7_9PEZI|nr:hypothetical protein EJ06DRAFT_546821 [Trichodelitschia bisporula]
MSANPRIPPLLQPYIQSLPQHSLTLITYTLSTTANWLTVRYLVGALSTDAPPDANAVLVSFLRDHDFWKAEARRAGGLDLTQLAKQTRFAFIDGLTHLFLPPPPSPPPENPIAPVPSSHRGSQSAVVLAALSAPTRQPAPPESSPFLPPGASESPRTPVPRQPRPSDRGVFLRQTLPPKFDPKSADTSGIFNIGNPSRNTRRPSELGPDTLLTRFVDTISAALDSLAPGPVTLVLDAPDVLLATALTDPRVMDKDMSLAGVLQGLRKRVHALVVVLPGDIVAAGAETLGAVEAAERAFVVGLAHAAETVLSPWISRDGRYRTDLRE